MAEQFWPLVTVLAFWGWVGAVIGLILTAFPAKGIFHARPALVWGGAALVSFALWIVAMRMA